MRVKLLSATLVLFISILALSWIFHGKGIIKNDAASNIFIPEELTMPLQVKVANNDKQIFFRYRWPAKQPHIYHDMLIYQKGKWVRHGKSTVGPEPEGIYEDRITMLVDDGSVPAFSAYGGYITIGDAMRFFIDQAKKSEVTKHPYLGTKKHKKDVRKYLPQTRTEIDSWASLVDEKQLTEQRAAGYFLDLWHWRAHRSNPIDKSDDQYVAEYRYGDKGKGIYFGNWDKKSKQPKLMFNPDKTGFYALRREDLSARKLGFEDVYYLREDQSIAFDKNYAWQEGDVIPRRVLRPGSGSHADISVHGKARWSEGYWDVSLVRDLDTGSPLDDKAFKQHRIYTLAFAVHRDATGSRWHYVSLPFSLGLKRQAEIQSHYIASAEPEWEKQAWSDITLFYPGQVSWPLVNSEKHAGRDEVKQNIPVKFRHTEEQLAMYGVEMEFDQAIRSQWAKTFWVGILFIISFVLAIYLLAVRRR